MSAEPGRGRLRRSDCTEEGIRRLRRGSGFAYVEREVLDLVS